jgi:8-oxo-dGTP diphosphatase
MRLEARVKSKWLREWWILTLGKPRLFRKSRVPGSLFSSYMSTILTQLPRLDYIFFAVYFRSMRVQSIEAPVLYLLITVMLFNLTQRSHGEHGEGKRFASLYAAGLLLALHLALLMIGRYFPAGGGEGFLIPVGLLFVAGLFLLRKKIFRFRRTCASCGAKLPLKTVLYFDDNLCDTCRDGVPGRGLRSEKHLAGLGTHSAELSALREEELEAKDPLVNPPKKNLLMEVPRKVEDFDWEAWEASETAVVCYIFDGPRVLLINKKRGLGRGKINAPGGRIEEGESPAEAAVREVQEEVGLTISDPLEVGRLSFVFTNGYSLKGHVFFARAFEGVPVETEEARPFWVPVEEIPYDQMWEDDIFWLPRVLDGAFIDGRFIFENDRMISHSLEESPGP